MQNEIDQPRVWQSYVWHGEQCFFVSTIRRKYDTYQGETTGLETMVWLYDYEEQKRIGTVIGHMGGVVDHQQICRCLIAEGVMLDENNPKHDRFTNSIPVHVIIAIDEDSGHQGLYVSGELIDQDTAIYASDIASAIGNKIAQVSHITVNMPDDVDGFPQKFDQCMLWKPIKT